MNPASCYLEISQDWLEGLNGEREIELPLERQAGGGLTSACKEKALARLQEFLKRNPLQPRPSVLCAIGGRGVSLRKLTLPASASENLERLLSMQVEKEFPVPPGELAWGYRALGSVEGPDKQNAFLVAAVKKEVVQEYAQLLSSCGVAPVFTLAAVARSALCPQSNGDYALLDIGRDVSELLSFENGAPASIRVLSWGDRQDGLNGALDSLAASVKSAARGKRIFLTGRTARQKEIAVALADRLGPGAQCAPAEMLPAGAPDSAIHALRRAAERSRDFPPLILRVQTAGGAEAKDRPASWKGFALAGALALGILALPYLEAVALKPLLSRRLAGLKADRGRLATIDRDLDFLRYLHQNQAPWLDTLYVMAKAAPPGARLDSLSMNRRGDLSWRATMKQPDQVIEFRSKLIKSGLFANVSVDEQAASADHRSLSVRMSAQWKPFNERQALSLAPTAGEIEKARNSPPELRTGSASPMPMGMPMMLPAAMAGPPTATFTRGATKPVRKPNGNAAQMQPMPIPLPPGSGGQ